jgi:hypothetical protein
MDGSTAIICPALSTRRHGSCFRQHEDALRPISAQIALRTSRLLAVSLRTRPTITRPPRHLPSTDGRSRVTGVLADKTPFSHSQRMNYLPLPCAGSASGPGACSRRQAGEVPGPDRWACPEC